MNHMITDQITADIKAAMKAGDRGRVGTLRQASAALKSAAIDAKVDQLDDTAAIKIIRKQAKQRNESIAAFKAGHREDLMAKEAAELAILQQYLPAEITVEAIRAKTQEIIASTGASSTQDFGQVMKGVMAAFQGTADGKKVQEVVKELLN
jgi:uncharacterized protein